MFSGDVQPKQPTFMERLAKRLGIDMNLARDIQNGDYNHQIKAWEDIVMKKEKKKKCY